MADYYTHKTEIRGKDPRRRICCSVAVLMGVTLMLAGCAHVPAEQQRLVSKPNMQFQKAPMFNPLNRLLTQFESSSASSVGGQSSGGACSACSL
ncbi:MAG: hypothetical protein KBI41_03975 [Kiritimatiellae bacterium]|jgi:tetrahydromethanopterin S-methyltransferase subunit E|nr:hypothetical protein [Kiritimatiellia bacterium]MDD2347902.1 hypothetical protein [Kiritimatiellia bacterium]MDD3582558.1 hypothetical protein [Kiritimatiellia bacterium]HHU15903.1 hypothetical protein [Lentisphaerota bacterium]HON46550.1 hypothetical protein [Kiritimatiellia bacterium]